jgi:hypothetical protein
MKDFLSNLLNQEEIKKNPLKFFAAFVAMKFEESDDKDKAHEKRLDDHYKKIGQLTDNKVEKEKFGELEKDYSNFKGRMTAYVIIGTIIINLLLWLGSEIIKYLSK